MRALSRRELIAGGAMLAGGVLAGASPFGTTATPSARRPNVVVVLADDLGYGELGSYGQRLIQTPHLDRMAAEGLRCTDFYAGNTICAPSRCSLLTGLHTGHTRIRNNAINGRPPRPQEPLLPEDVTFAEVLKAAGYTTGLFGKWGFGPDSRALGEPDEEFEAHPSWPLQKGFDEFFGFIHHHHATNGYYATYAWEGNSRVEFPENKRDARQTYLPDVYVERALDFIDRHRDEPFLLELGIQLPHTPNHAPSTEPYADRPWPETTKKHAAMVTRLDAYVGRLLKQLRILDLADDTIVFVTSDNGPHDETTLYGGDLRSDVATPGLGSAADNAIFDSNGPLRGAKHNLYEGGIRVPMIVWGQIPGGRVSHEPWAAYDLLPTLADYAGITPPRDIDGHSVRPLLSGGRQEPAPYLYWERPDYATPTMESTAAERGHVVGYVQAVRSGPWKAVRHSNQTTPYGPLDATAHTELYDLDADIGETRDVSGAHPDVVRELQVQMQAAHAPPPVAREPWRTS